MIFTQRYHRALKAGRLTVSISDEARAKLVTCIATFNASLGVRRDPNDNWVSNSSVVEEAILELMMEHGWDEIPGTDATRRGEYYEAFRHLVRKGEGAVLFDFSELAMAHMDAADDERCRIKINQIFDLEDCPWRISDGEFFKLDSDFIAARIADVAHETLVANRFAGAADEYAKARQELASGDVKDGIIHAAKSFESVMKVMTGVAHANADQLIRTMLSQGYFEDLPEAVRAGFAEQVMKTLPFLRNKLAGHGQGAEVVNVPTAYGELAIQLAGAFHNFLISKHLERQPTPVPDETPASTPRPTTAIDDDIPF